MWVDVDGVCHTVAQPNPTELMSDVFRRSLERLVDESAEELAALLSSEENSFILEERRRSPSDVEELAFQGARPPLGLLVAAVESVDELRSRVLEIDRRWRLDLITALDDWVDVCRSREDSS